LGILKLARVLQLQVREDRLDLKTSVSAEQTPDLGPHMHEQVRPFPPACHCGKSFGNSLSWQSFRSVLASIPTLLAAVS
jgi:hypothetical protein